MRPVCVVLAGGRSSRMGGGHKGLLMVDGIPMLERVLTGVAPQVEAVLINSNGDPMLFGKYGLPVLADCVPGYLGPLAGLLTGMVWARQYYPHATHLLSVPCDTPCLPGDFVARLTENLGDHAIAIACETGCVHPTLGLWPICLADRLAADLVSNGARRVWAWLSQFAVCEVMFDAACLRNVNTPEDLARICDQHKSTTAILRISLSHSPSSRYSRQSVCDSLA